MDAAARHEHHGHGHEHDHAGMFEFEEDADHLQRAPARTPPTTATTATSSLSFSLEREEPDPHCGEYENEDEVEPLKRVPLVDTAPPVPEGDSLEVHVAAAVPDTRAAVCVDSFELLSLLGRGAYGKVFLVRHRDTDRLYAMKVLRKGQINKAATKSERHVLEVANSPFLVSLRFAFQTDTKLYLIMDYAEGGELFALISRVGLMGESEAVFYAGEILLAVQHLHSQGIIYRDLKPENVMIDGNGHVLLTDFGFAKLHVGAESGRAGTPAYMAPEIVREQGHGKPADWWAYGCLVYELLVGKTPFEHKDRKKVHDNILNKKIAFPRHVSPTARSLIKGLLTRAPHKRLGTACVDEIKNHPFFEGLNWKKLAEHGLRPPHVPSLASKLDTSNFDEKFTSAEPLDSPVLQPGKMSAFSDFSYADLGHHATTADSRSPPLAAAQEPGIAPSPIGALPRVNADHPQSAGGASLRHPRNAFMLQQQEKDDDPNK